MSVISARKNQNLYVLTKDNFWWLSTLSTSRKGCWDYVSKNTQTTKARLKFDGYRCARVRLEEEKGR